MPKYNYRLITLKEILSAAADLNVDISELELIMGLDVGALDKDKFSLETTFPHYVRVILAALTLPTAWPIAKQITNAVYNEDDDSYNAMEPPEFARNLDGTEWTFGQFCRISGMDYDELKMDMLVNRTKNIPHFVRVLFAVYNVPGVSDMIRQVSDSVITKAGGFNKEAKKRYGYGQDAKEEIAVEVKPKKRFSSNGKL